MAKVFTRQGAKDIHAKFDKMCKEFAEQNGVEMDRSNLTFGEDLTFKIKFSLPDNKLEAWDNMVSYFKSNGIDIYIGKKFMANRKQYRINGKLNPANSKFKIGATENTLGGKDTYFTIDGINSVLNINLK